MDIMSMGNDAAYMQAQPLARRIQHPQWLTVTDWPKKTETVFRSKNGCKNLRPNSARKTLQIQAVFRWGCKIFRITVTLSFLFGN
jgi:hypothetical protein